MAWGSGKWGETSWGGGTPAGPGTPPEAPPAPPPLPIQIGTGGVGFEAD